MAMPALVRLDTSDAEAPFSSLEAPVGIAGRFLLPPVGEVPFCPLVVGNAVVLLFLLVSESDFQFLAQVTAKFSIGSALMVTGCEGNG